MVYCTKRQITHPPPPFDDISELFFSETRRERPTQSKPRKKKKCAVRKVRSRRDLPSDSRIARDVRTSPCRDNQIGKPGGGMYGTRHMLRYRRPIFCFLKLLPHLHLRSSVYHLYTDRYLTEKYYSPKTGSTTR